MNFSIFFHGLILYDIAFQLLGSNTSYLIAVFCILFKACFFVMKPGACSIKTYEFIISYSQILTVNFHIYLEKMLITPICPYITINFCGISPRNI